MIPQRQTGALAAAVITVVAVAVNVVSHGYYYPERYDPSHAVVVAACFAVFLLTITWPQRRMRTTTAYEMSAQRIVLLLLCSFTILLLVRGLSTPILLIIVATTIPAQMGLSKAVLMISLWNVALFLIARFHWGWSTAQALLNTLPYLGFQMFAYSAARLAFREQTMRRNYELVNNHLLSTRKLLTHTTREQERLRLSRELHDLTGHKLTALGLRLQMLRNEVPAETRDKLDELHNLTRDITDDIRAVVSQLRRHDGIDLRQAVEDLAVLFPHVELHLEGFGDVRPASVDQAEAILRVVQESVNNATRHGHAQNLWIKLNRADQQIILTITDDGSHQGELTWGNGLLGIQERINELKGTFRVNNVLPQGLSLRIALPQA